MDKVDLHTHILPQDWAELEARYGATGLLKIEHHAPCKARLIQDGKVFREIGDNCWDAAKRLAECDAAGVGLQVLSTVPVMFGYGAPPEQGADVARYLNDHLARTVAAHRDRFAGLGTLPLQAPDLAVRELERCVKELHLDGVQIGTHVNAWGLDAPELFPVFQTAEKLGAAVFVHPWDMPRPAHLEKYWQPWLVGMPMETAAAICQVLFGGVLERLPHLRLCFAHGGGSFAATVGRVQHGFDARPDLCAVDNKVSPKNYLGAFWVDSLVHDAPALRLILERFGAERVALGTDYPFPLGEAAPGALIESMELPAATRKRLLAENALEFLRG